MWRLACRLYIPARSVLSHHQRTAVVRASYLRSITKHSAPFSTTEDKTAPTLTEDNGDHQLPTKSDDSHLGYSRKAANSNSSEHPWFRGNILPTSRKIGVDNFVLGGVLTTREMILERLEKLTVVEDIGTEPVSTNTVHKLLRTCSEGLLLETPQERLAFINSIWQKIKEHKLNTETSMYNVLLSVYSNLKHKFSPSDFLQEMNSDGILPNSLTLNLLLLGYCNQGDMEGGKAILEHMKEQEIPASEQTFVALIKGHAKNGDMTSAKAMFQTMKESGIAPTTSSYAALAGAYAQQNNMAAVYEVLDEMQRNRVFASHEVHLSILEGLAYSDQVEHMREVLGKIRNKKWLLSDLKLLMLSLASSGHFDSCFCILEVLLAYRRHLSASLIHQCVRVITHHMAAYNASGDTLMQCLQILSPLTGSFGDNVWKPAVLWCAYHIKDPNISLNLIRELHSQGVPIKQHFFYPILVQFNRRSDHDGILRVLKCHKEMDIPWQAKLFDFLLEGGWEGKGTYLVELLKEAGLYDSLSMNQQLLWFLWRARQMELLLQCVKEHHLGETELRDFLSSYTIVEVNRTFLVKNIIPLYQAVLEVEPNVNLFHSVTMVVRKLFADGGPLDAVHLVKRLFELNLLPSSREAICSTVLKNLASKRLNKEFSQFVSIMQSHGMELRDGDLRYLLAVIPIRTDKDIQTFMSTFSEMKSPDEMAYSVVVEKLAKAGKTTQAVSLYQEMTEKQLKLSYDAFVALTDLYLSVGNMEEAEQIRQDMMAAGYKEGFLSRRSLVKALAMKGEFENAKHEIERAKLELAKKDDDLIPLYTALIQGYNTHQNMDGIKEVLELLKARGLRIPPNSIGKVLSLHVTRREIDEAMSVLRESERVYGSKPNMSAMLYLYNALTKMGDQDKRDEVLQFMTLNERAATNVKFYAELQAGHVDKAKEISEMPSFQPDKKQLESFIINLNRDQKGHLIGIVEELMANRYGARDARRALDGEGFASREKQNVGSGSSEMETEVPTENIEENSIK